MINNGKTFVININERLDSLLEPTIAVIKEKYTEKNMTIDECDELFDKANASCDNLQSICGKQLAKLELVT